MPLSEHEQRMLRQIERQFQQERGLARSLRVPADPHEAARNAKRALAGFAVGLLALLISFASSWVVGLVGFLVMLAAALVLVQCLRSLAHDHWGKASSQVPGPAESPEGRGGPPGDRRWWPGWGAGGHGRRNDEPR